ncbi:hypothetical protein Pint_28430 [Pistacia integerrima]|uniref:Uncharacterized protein n=1 Tax=Pistacia integerrima TaxID=434235 RepID=A0ACC0YUU0_9ROSI|nr:hypothetical protein Pint_28430 [Pistacia integerrima]
MNWNQWAPTSSSRHVLVLFEDQFLISMLHMIYNIGSSWYWGTGSMDWASMVMQMYKSHAQQRGYGVTLVHEMSGEIAGIKVRIAPFDSGKQQQTSVAAVAVMAILGDGSTRVQINESDLRIERFRAEGGAGGQHVNTTESAVRIVHIPTGDWSYCY